MTDTLLAEIQAHPLYEKVKALNPAREPSLIELNEHAAIEAFAGTSKAEKLGTLLQNLLTEAQNQVQHNGPVSPSIVSQIQAIIGHLKA